jgi:cellulose synthase/poly-beta-1,6-N-acetylglucosamine synthase-like glycosyltransferase
MIAISILLLAAGVLYARLIFSFTGGWKNLPAFSCDNDEACNENIFVSIIIAARNEEDNIAVCLEDLCKQDYHSGNFEIIVVDDHSTDNTISEVQRIKQRNANIKLVNLAEQQSSANGKKAAIASGVDQARGELIITTDADCRFNRQWLSCIVKYYSQHQPVMISAPVAFLPQKSVGGKFMELEFISLVTAGAGALGLNKPLMCNGANLAFRRDVFLELKPFQESEKWASGDDMFLMQNIREKYGSHAIHFLKSSGAIVKTKAPAGVKEFIMQRIRWGSKTRAYPGSFTAMVAAIVFMNSLMLLGGTVFLVFSSGLILPVLAGWFLKISSDALLLYQGCTFFQRRKLLIWFIPFQIIYVLYITLGTLLAGSKGYVWKGRKH